MHDPIAESLAADDDDLERSWSTLQSRLGHRFGESVGLEGILFLIGVQEQGSGFEPRLKKERKQDLIMRGTHHVLEMLGIYRRVDDEAEGAHWERRYDLPMLTVEQQEKLLRVAIIRYFSRHEGFGPQPRTWTSN